MGAVTVSIDIQVVLGNGLAPLGTALEFVVVDMNSGIDDVDIDTLAGATVVQVLGERAKA